MGSQTVTLGPEEEDKNSNDYVVLRFPSRRDRERDCDSNLLPKPISGDAASTDYHAHCGALGVRGAGAERHRRQNSGRMSAYSATPPKDERGDDNEVFDDSEWRQKCEEFNRGDFLRSSSSSAPCR